MLETRFCFFFKVVSRVEQIPDLYDLSDLYDVYDLHDLYDLYDLYDLPHIAGWEPYNLRDPAGSAVRFLICMM